MKSDQERVKTLLTDTIILLCKNGLSFNNKFRIQGLLGITLDDDNIFLLDIDEKISKDEESLNDLIFNSEESNATVCVKKDHTIIEEQIYNHSPTMGTSDHRKNRRKNYSPTYLNKSYQNDIINLEEEENIIFDYNQNINNQSRTTDNFVNVLNEMANSFNDRDEFNQLNKLKKENDCLEPFQSFTKHGFSNENTNFLQNNSSSLFFSKQSDALKTTQNENYNLLPKSNNIKTSPSINNFSKKFSSKKPNKNCMDAGFNIEQPELSQQNQFNSKFWSPRRKKNGVKPYICFVSNCQRTFFRGSELYRHQRDKHGAKHIKPRIQNINSNLIDFT